MTPRNRSKVLHKQIYRHLPWGGIINTTICGRVHQGHDYNVAEDDAGVSCTYCQRIMQQRGRQ